MPDNYTLLGVNQPDVDVRLVGVINENECEAILNDEEAANKIATAATISFSDFAPYYEGNRRFILVVRNKHPRFNNQSPIVFISPLIISGHYSSIERSWTIYCDVDKASYTNMYKFKSKE